jgi:hypothetical protein
MKRYALYLPVLLVGLPLLIGLLLASTPSGETASAPAKPDALVVALADKEQLPDAAEMEKLARTDPVGFLENCLRRYQREVKGYSLVMQKQERLRGKLYPKEVMEVCFQENPYSVYLHWIQGARKAERVVFVAGENNGKMLVHPEGLAGRFVKVVERDVAGEDAKESGRYTLDQFGIANGTRRTLKSMQAAQKKGTLHMEYLGEQKVIEAGNRACYKLHRNYEEPENDGVMELTLYIDKETWLQVGSVVKARDNKLLGEYYFRDIHINPEFKPDQFKRSALTP